MRKDHDMTIHKIIKVKNHIKTCSILLVIKIKTLWQKLGIDFLFVFQIAEDFKNIQGFQEFCL